MKMKWVSVSLIALLMGFWVRGFFQPDVKNSNTDFSISNVSANAASAGAKSPLVELVKKTEPAVVNISTFARPKAPQGYYAQDEMMRRFFEEFFGGGGPQFRMPPKRRVEPKQPKSQQIALGTGFVIDEKEGLLLTNHHVIQGAEEVKVQFREEDLELEPAEIIGSDPELDVALLKVKTKRKLTALPLGDSDLAEKGEELIAIGNPLGYGHYVSRGILSAKNTKTPEFRLGRYLQTDAAINPGNSGGPLINSDGQVIGINNAIDARGQGIGFAIPINLVKAILPQLKSKGSVSRGFLGVSVSEFTPELAESLGMNSKERGVLISEVQEGEAAEKAGLKPYDLIKEIQGEPVIQPSDVSSIVGNLTVGTEVKVKILRSGKEQTVPVKLGERNSGGGLFGFRKKTPDPRRGGYAGEAGIFERLGFVAQEVTQEGSGKVIRIVEVRSGSNADQAGLAAGDFILDVQGKSVKTLTDLSRALSEKSKKSAVIRVKRIEGSGTWISMIPLSLEDE